MSKRIYSTKALRTDEFPNYDGHGWYKEVSDEEFSELATNSRIRHAGGRFFATGSFDEARTAAERLGPVEDTSPREPDSAKSSTVQQSGGIYANPGAILKGIASAIFYIGLVISVITAFVLGTALAGWGSSFNFGIFLGIALIGSLISYLSGLGLAALGDIAKNLNEINRKIK